MHPHESPGAQAFHRHEARLARAERLAAGRKDRTRQPGVAGVKALTPRPSRGAGKRAAIRYSSEER